MSKNTFAQFLDTVGTLKSAASTEDPGGADGPTEHPVKNEENHTQTAEEGSRSDEHSEDVKDQIGPASVDASKEAMEGVNPPGNAADMQPQIGVKQAPTGEDPANETASAKATKDDASTGTAPGDPGYTEHPARTDNDSLDGMKYASMSTRELNKLATDLGNSILQQLCSQSSAPSKQAAAEKQSSELDTQQAAELGWSLAGLVSENFDKQAADELVQNQLQMIIKTASDDADRVAEFLLSFQKAAMDEAAAAGAMGGGMPPEAAMAAAGGMPPEAAMAAGGGAGVPSDDEAAQILMLLEQLGITPEQLMELIAQQAGQGAGAAPAAATDDGAAAMPTPDMAGMEVQASAKPSKAAAKSAQDVIKELLQRSK